MWRTYCAQLRDTPNKDIDLTLFATAGEKRGTLYVSEQVISSLWEDLKHMASDPSAQSTEEEEEETETPTKAEPTKAEPTKAEPTKAEPKTPAKADKVAPAPKAVKTKAGTGKTAPPADDDDI
jgi:outer membrane biosynthesis protein TonB